MDCMYQAYLDSVLFPQQLFFMLSIILLQSNLISPLDMQDSNICFIPGFFSKKDPISQQLVFFVSLILMLPFVFNFAAVIAAMNNIIHILIKTRAGAKRIRDIIKKIMVQIFYFIFLFGAASNSPFSL